ncbi:MAG: sigma-70 family RNA polymerase sigma factor, partial [Bryobacteraceae bacterium]|nr:sigma-70 family RNA polymerase sigma factor [Bryobacteraceae bacterium]
LDEVRGQIRARHDARAHDPGSWQVRRDTPHQDVARNGEQPRPDEDDREDRDRLQSALAELGERERAALVLRDLEGLSTAEVAEAMGTTESTVRVQIAKARLKLRELLRGVRA